MAKEVEFKGLAIIEFPDDWSDEAILDELKSKDAEVTRWVTRSIKEAAVAETDDEPDSQASGFRENLGGAAGSVAEGAAGMVSGGARQVAVAAELAPPTPPRGTLFGGSSVGPPLSASERTEQARKEETYERQRPTTPEELVRRIEANPATRFAERLEQGTAERFPTLPGQREGFWTGSVPRGVGSAVGAVAAGVVAGPVAAGMAMFGAEANDAYTEEMARQAANGERPDPYTAFGKAAAYGSWAAAVETKLGAGHIAKRLKQAFGAGLKPTKAGLVPFVGGLLKEAGFGFSEEALQRGGQDVIVHGNVDLDAMAEEGAAGAVVQGLFHVPVSVAEARKRRRLAPLSGETADRMGEQARETPPAAGGEQTAQDQEGELTARVAALTGGDVVDLTEEEVAVPGPITGSEEAVAAAASPDETLPAMSPGGTHGDPVPEDPAALAEQLRLTADPESNKAATLFTPGETPPPTGPDGLEVVDTQHGPVVYNPAKITEAEVLKAASGKLFDGRILGMAATGADVSSPIVVTTSTDAAKNVITEVVAPDRASIEAAIAAQQASVPRGTSEVRPAIEVAQERIAANQTEGSNEGQAEPAVGSVGAVPERLPVEPVQGDQDGTTAAVQGSPPPSADRPAPGEQPAGGSVPPDAVRGGEAQSLPAAQRETVDQVLKRSKATLDEIDAFLDSLKIETKGTLHAFGVVPLVWNAAIDLAKAAVRGGAAVASAVRTAIDYIRANHKGDWDEPGATAAIYAAMESERPVPRQKGDRGESQSALGRYSYAKQTEAAREKFAVEWVDSFNGDLGLASRRLMDVDDPGYRSVVAAEILARASEKFLGSNVAERLEYDNLVRTVTPQLLQGGTEAGQSLQARNQANEKVKPYATLFAYLDLIQKRLTEVLGKLDTGKMTSDITEANEKAGNDAAGYVGDAVAGPKRKKGAPKTPPDGPSPAFERSAKALISKFATIQSDTPTFRAQRIDQVYAAFRALVAGEITPDQFAAALAALNVSQQEITTLGAIAARERQAAEAAAFAKRRETIAKLFKNPSALLRLLQKAGRLDGVDWEDLFRLSAETQRGRQIELFRKVDALPELDDLTRAERLELSNALFASWHAQRMRVFGREFGRIVGAPTIPKSKREKLSKAFPRIIQAINLGTWNEQAFRDAIALEFGVGSVGDGTATEIAQLGREAQRVPEGMMRNRVYQRMVDKLTQAAGINSYDLLRDFWFANVLSGMRTLIAIGFGSWLSGFTMTGRAAIETAFRPSLGPRAAARIVASFVSGIGEGILNGIDIIKTGDASRLPETTERLFQQLSGKGRADSLEAAKKFGTGWKKLVGQLSYVRRIVVALDMMGAVGARSAGLIYTAASREDWESLSMALLRTDKRANAEARKQAVEDLGPGAKAVDVLHRTKEILEEGISAEVKEGATTLGRVAALNADPVGIGGLLYRVIAALPWILKAPLGLSFARAAINMAQNASDWMPVAGLVNYGRAAATDTDWFASLPKLHPFRAFGIDVPVERRRLILSAQIGGLALTLAAIGLFLRPDEDDEERDIDISGTWYKLTPKKRSQLMAQGERPMAIRIGKTWIQYKDTPFAAALGLVGSLRDKQRFRGEEYKAEGLIERAVNAWLLGAIGIKDATPLSQFSNLVGMSASNTDELSSVNKSLAQAIGNTAAGFLPAVSLLREIDTMLEPGVYRPTGGMEFWIRNIPFARRSVGAGAGVNALGETISAPRSPWGRWLSGEPEDPTWTWLSKQASQGTFVPVPAKTALIIGRDRKRRQMNATEYLAYQTAAGKAWRGAIEGALPRYLANATPKQVEQWFERRTDDIHQAARAKVRATE